MSLIEVLLSLSLILPNVESFFGGCGGGGGILSGILGMNTGYGYGGYGGYGGGYGMGACGAGSIFHHWVCCDYNVYECCIQLETWVIILLVLVGFGLLICVCLGLAACVFGMKSS